MNKELVQVKIRPHLVSFLFNELEGQEEAVYQSKKVKLAKVSRASLLGKMIESFKASAKKTILSRPQAFNIFLTINDNGENTGSFHEKINTSYTALELSQEHAFILNETLESMFRISAVEFIKGFAIDSTKKNFVDEAIHKFMITHNLYETEIDPQSLRRYYYNSLKKKHSLSRIQNQIGNRSFYFYSA